MKIKKILKRLIQLIGLLAFLYFLFEVGTYALINAFYVAWNTSIESSLEDRSMDLSKIHDRRITIFDLDACSEHDLYVYQKCMETVKEIAEGQRTSTVLEIHVEDMLGKLIFTPEECGFDKFTRKNYREAVADILDFNVRQLGLYMECEYPFDMYWYDYPAGIYVDPFRIKISKEGELVLPATIKVKMRVSPDYQKPGKKYEVDPEKSVIALEARNRALQIVDEARSLSDIDKLLYYCDAICERNVYQRDESKDYGNTSQMVYIFDEDPNTHAMCSGYTKAFQFLCDQTDFDSNIFCYSVIGDKNGGAHMWNIVHMDDDKYYLACITTCDNNPIPGRRTRFLEGADSGDRREGYTFDAEEIEVDGELCKLPKATFTYKDRTSYIWSDSILNISMEDYRY